MNSKLKQIPVTWAVVYPIITSLTGLLDPLIGDWLLPLRTLVLSILMVPTMVLWAMPFAARLLSPLRAGSGARNLADTAQRRP